MEGISGFLHIILIGLLIAIMVKIGIRQTETLKMLEDITQYEYIKIPDDGGFRLRR